MKIAKKALALVLTLAIVMSLGIAAFAAETSDYSITVHNTIGTSNVSIKGQTFKAYKVFNVTYSGMPGTDDTANASKPHTYTIADEFAGVPDGSDGWTVDPLTFNGKTGDDIVAELAGESNDSQVLYQFAKAVKDYIDLHDKDGSGDKKDVTFAPLTGDTLVTVPAAPDAEHPVTEESIKIDVTEPGYYLVLAQGSAMNKESSSSEVVTASLGLDTTNANSVIEFKGQAPVLTKQGNSQNTAVDAKVGEDVTFTLNTTVPAMFGFENYEMIFHDNLSKGLTLKTSGVSGAVAAGDVTVTIGGAELTYDTDFKVTKAAGAATGETALTVKILDLKALDMDSAGHAAVEKDAPIVVTYKATVNGKSIKSVNELNTAYIEYSNNPYDTASSHGKTVKDEVKVYNFDLDVDKYTEKAASGTTVQNIKLAGAQFMLYRMNSSDREYYKIDDTTGEVTWVQAANASAAQTSSATVRTTVLEGADADQISKLDKPFSGLDADTYYLEETKAPEGYNKLKTPVKVQINTVYNASTHALERVEYIVDGVKMPAAASESSNPGVAVGSSRVTYSPAVKNLAGAELPSTGGIGTTIFYTVGAILMVTALVLLITKKKMSSN